MERMKVFIHDLASRLGYAIQKKPPEKFPPSAELPRLVERELFRLPRYQEHEVELMGNKMRIADAASFLHMFDAIFRQQIYRFNSQNTSPVIIDCGANYGVAIAYFKQQYPNAHIKAVEADPGIFEILVSNVGAARFKNVELINKAVMDCAGEVDFYSEGADAGRTSHSNSAVKATKVASVTLDTLIDGPVDFLKMDIEGVETQVLRKCTKLGMVEQIFIEYHSFVDQPQVLAELLEILSGNGFRYYIHTEHCSPRPLLEDKIQMGFDLQLNIFARRRHT